MANHRRSTTQAILVGAALVLILAPFALDEAVQCAVARDEIGRAAARVGRCVSRDRGAGVMTWGHRPDEADAARQAAELSREMGDLPKLVGALWILHGGLVLSGRPNEVLDTWEELRQLGERLGLYVVRSNLAWSRGRCDWITTADLHDLER